MPLIAPDPDVVEVRPQRRRHPGLVVLGTLLVTGGLVWGGFTAATGGGDAELPSPTPRVGGSLTLEQKTALAWNEWSAATRESACLDEHGYDIAPTVSAYEGELSDVAAFLTVHAIEPEALSGYLPRTGAMPTELLRGIDSGGCRVVRDLLDLDDATTVDDLVRRARADAVFHAYLAGALWVDANAGAVLASYLDLVEQGDQPAQGAWDGGAASEALASAVAIAHEASSWTMVGSSSAAGYVQSWGQTSGGAAIVLRVEPAGATHQMPILWGSPQNPVRCGELQVSLSMGEVLINYEGPQRGDVFDIRDALGEEWCGLGVEALDGDSTGRADGAGAAADERQ